MTDKVCFTSSGRGLPTYFLCLANSGSTIYSDGASRIFALSDGSTLAKDTDYSIGSRESFRVSSKSVSFVDIEPCSTSSSLTSKVTRNNSRRDIDFASDGTRPMSCYSSSFIRSNSQLALKSIGYDA